MQLPLDEQELIPAPIFEPFQARVEAHNAQHDHLTRKQHYTLLIGSLSWSRLRAARAASPVYGNISLPGKRPTLPLSFFCR